MNILCVVAQQHGIEQLSTISKNRLIKCLCTRALYIVSAYIRERVHVCVCMGLCVYVCV